MDSSDHGLVSFDLKSSLVNVKDHNIRFTELSLSSDLDKIGRNRIPASHRALQAFEVANMEKRIIARSEFVLRDQLNSDRSKLRS